MTQFSTISLFEGMPGSLFIANFYREADKVSAACGIRWHASWNLPASRAIPQLEELAAALKTYRTQHGLGTAHFNQVPRTADGYDFHFDVALSLARDLVACANHAGVLMQVQIYQHYQHITFKD